MHKVAVLALDGVRAFELVIPTRVLGAANAPDGSPLYEVRVCSPGARPVTSDAGFSIAIEHGTEILRDADTVVVAPTLAMRDRGRDGVPADVLPVLTGLRPGTRVVGLCAAAFALAAAGLLDGRPATTHWREAEDFRVSFPDVRLDRDVLFVDDGDVLTSAGVAAGIDLCLHLVRRDHGASVANDVARACVVPPWREGGQAQYVQAVVPADDGASTAAARAWALTQLHRPLALGELARHARMSVRTFNRRFRAETGTTPGQWITLQRVDLARALLETTALTIDHIAAVTGFGSPRSLREHLRRVLGVSPSAYRQTFADRTPADRGLPESPSLPPADSAGAVPGQVRRRRPQAA
ncbi:GlxA family transcriptional regulator [Streptomyces hygroscopicus]|uniref:GlxA family transcriptional regulator n=1 Tax=Streptomyces hygroscopicus TaxID=1912 RepID=UPI00068AB777|nr:helix-turn-helix domain-containing protein [Streptomyces hygroscopicus]